MRLTSANALASRQAPNRNASDDLALVSCSDTLVRSRLFRQNALIFGVTDPNASYLLRFREALESGWVGHSQF
jgi:hypothetical protein